MILVSCVYTNKNNNSNKNKNENISNNENDIEELMFTDSSTERADTELNKFFEKEKEKNSYNEIENYMDKDKKPDTEDINMLETVKGKKKAAKKKSKSSKKGANKTKSKPKKTYPPAKLISQFNPYYPKKKALIDSNTSASYCKFKKGFLHLVKNSNKLGATPLTIRTVPVYVSLTMYTFNIQMGLAFKTLFNTVKVKNILKITKKFKNANCFEIVEDNVVEKTLAKSPITLCAGNTKIMMQWVKALQEFKDCLYNVSSKNTGSRTLMDFNRINTLIKVAHVTPKAKIPKAFNPLVYENGPSVNKKTKKAAKDEYVMKRQLAKIVGLLERGRINKQKLTRKMNTKLKNAKKIEYDIRTKQDMINKIINKRERREKEKEYKIRAQVHKKREIQLLKAVKSRIKQYKVN